ncbi:DUF1648 domain-containing protein [Streptomyces sp. SID10815]|uniref:DUF1648 domain-containing protein n=1 Tax=Streptomyces sp. SID10815 TaxID=2706027 RepID=UPI0013CA7EF2|nr:DUF1648 domain-containing protein [Streptomyces sp. SID10815]
MAWTVGAAALIAALPWSASGRLPDRLATHWKLGDGAPDGSMPLWAASIFPALIWLGLAAVVLLMLRRGAGSSPAPGEAWTATALLSTGALLIGAQASVVRANLDRADWHDAHQPTPWLVATLVATVVGGIAGWLVTVRRRQAAAPAAQERPPGPVLQIPEGQRMVWLSRTVNPWLQLLAAMTGLVAVAAGIALVSGLAEPAQFGALFIPFALASLAVAGCAAVQARVSERGLEVAFGPFGWPVRRWDAADIESARTEDRTPAQVGGWGYRLSGLGTTVMLRRGQCLVIRTRSEGKEFAVSVDDAERGAALLNALSTPQSR